MLAFDKVSCQLFSKENAYLELQTKCLLTLEPSDPRIITSPAASKFFRVPGTVSQRYTSRREKEFDSYKFIDLW